MLLPPTIPHHGLRNQYLRRPRSGSEQDYNQRADCNISPTVFPDKEIKELVTKPHRSITTSRSPSFPQHRQILHHSPMFLLLHLRRQLLCPPPTRNASLKASTARKAAQTTYRAFHNTFAPHSPLSHSFIFHPTCFYYFSHAHSSKLNTICVLCYPPSH